MNAAAEARCLAAELGCEVTPHPLLDGVVEARDPAPGVWLLAGTPGEIRAEMRVTPKITEAAGVIRAMIAGGTLLPGEAAPDGGTLHAMTGISRAYCYRALRLLERAGTLTRATPRGRIWRVAGTAR